MKMKKIWALAAVCVCLSFSLGVQYGRSKEREDWETLQEGRCRALISFSLDRLEELKAGYAPGRQRRFSRRAA